MDDVVPEPKRPRPQREPAPTTPDPIEMAMEAEAGDAAVDSPARTLLINQNRLIMADLRHRGWQIAGERMGAVLKGFGVAAAALATVAVGVMVWQASRANGVVIEAFSVPPDFADKGLTGEVVAGQLQDRLVQLQAQTNSARAGDTYANNWGRDIKVVIPQTGVSLGELQRYLREWLGHETHIGGEIFRTPTGLALTVRANGEAGDPVAGPEADLEKLLTGGAMALYKKTQPYRWAVYQSRNGAWAEAQPMVEQLAASGDVEERGWAHNNLRSEAQTTDAAAAYAKEGLRVSPRTAILWDGLSGIEQGRGHLEAARDATLRATALWKSHDRGGYREEIAERQLHARTSLMASWVGDHLASLRETQAVLASPDPLIRKSAMRAISRHFASLHQPGRALQQLAPPLDDAAILAEALTPDNDVPTTLPLTRFTIARQQGDWAEAYRQAAAVQALVDNPPKDAKSPNRLKLLATTSVWPALAEALAHVGRLEEAQALAVRMPTDCYGCLLARANVAEIGGDAAAADRWFGEAVRQGPHFNAAQTDWGRALLARGRADAAIAQFKAANKIGPRFADPIEGWGEALLAKGDAKGAAAKFAQANRYAPDWGRLHLQWGQALAKQGKAEDARAQFARAAALDLTPAERAELQAVTQKRTN